MISDDAVLEAIQNTYKAKLRALKREVEGMVPIRFWNKTAQFNLVKGIWWEK